MIAGRVGDGVDRFDAGFLPRQWQYRLDGCDRRVMSFLIGGTSLAHFTVGQARAAPSRQAILGRYWWVFDRHASMLPQFTEPRKYKRNELEGVQTENRRDFWRWSSRLTSL